MKVNVTPLGSDVSVSYVARKYAFPKKGNQSEKYSLVLNGVNVGSDVVRTTGGGKYPAYTYFMYEGASWYLPKEAGALVDGSKIDVVVEAPAPAADGTDVAGFVGAPIPGSGVAPARELKKSAKK